LELIVYGLCHSNKKSNHQKKDKKTLRNIFLK